MTRSLAERKVAAAQSARRAVGYCGLRHPHSNAFCTRRPHIDTGHEDYYTGRQSITDTTGTGWTE
ncbi:hypothetical protein GT045_36620 [Streptomyces sp. SID486]|uniref:hypothetical protein n=1 Tax=Streptomyces sp. SID486 TaxID=2690264 RepID=UPI001368965F|nr:hypothetical protein [Streptomyces sp. SID486]MYY00167.1 hypothetical protein [Streptomyces sp. SID486]